MGRFSSHMSQTMLLEHTQAAAKDISLLIQRVMAPAMMVGCEITLEHFAFTFHSHSRDWLAVRVVIIHQ